MWEIEFPFTILQKELENLKSDLPFLGKHFRDVNGQIHFTTAFGREEYGEIESFKVTNITGKNSQNLKATVTKKPIVDNLKINFSKAEDRMTINARTILQLDHKFQEDKFMSDEHLQFFYKW